MQTPFKDQGFTDPGFHASSAAPGDATPLLLVEEFSHRVINELSLAVTTLRTQARYAGDQHSRRAVEEAADSLCKFADIHRALQRPQGDEIVDLTAWLDRVCRALTAGVLRDRRVLLSLSGDSIAMPADRAWRVALIVSELVTNAMRHGLHPDEGIILVRVDDIGGVLACHVIDNGGARQAPCPPPRPSRGLSLVRRLAWDMNGEAHWTFGARGTRADIVIPLLAPARQPPHPQAYGA